jgi:hypothetical protein
MLHLCHQSAQLISVLQKASVMLCLLAYIRIRIGSAVYCRNNRVGSTISLRGIEQRRERLEREREGHPAMPE